MSNVIYLIVGESGCGKDTIVNELCNRYGYKRIQSYTTRPERKDDFKDKISHIFVSETEFNQLKNIVAFGTYGGNKYCATQEQVDNNDFYIIDCEGIEYFKKHYKGDKIVKTIYISVKEENRFTRMLSRGDKGEEALNRIKNDRIKFWNATQLADVTYRNDCTNGLDDVVKEINQYITLNNTIYDNERNDERTVD